MSADQPHLVFRIAHLARGVITLHASVIELSDPYPAAFLRVNTRHVFLMTSLTRIEDDTVHCKGDFLFCVREFDSARTLSLTLVGRDMKRTQFPRTQ